MTLPAPERYFPFESDDPWAWVPGRWVREGTVFIAGDDRFYRLTRETPDGWWAEEVASKVVGDQSEVKAILAQRVKLEVAAAEYRRVGSASPDTGPIINRLDDMRHKLIGMCNPRAAELRVPDFDVERIRKWLLAILLPLQALTLLLAWSVLRRLNSFARHQGYTMLGVSFGLLLGVSAILVAVTYVSWRRPQHLRRLARRLSPSGNLVGCAGLLLLAVVAVVIAWLAIVLLAGFSGRVQ